MQQQPLSPCRCPEIALRRRNTSISRILSCDFCGLQSKGHKLKRCARQRLVSDAGALIRSCANGNSWGYTGIRCSEKPQLNWRWRTAAQLGQVLVHFRLGNVVSRGLHCRLFRWQELPLLRWSWFAVNWRSWHSSCTRFFSDHKTFHNFYRAALNAGRSSQEKAARLPVRRGADPGGAGGAAAPPILILVVQTYHFAPPIIPVHK